MSEQNQHAAIDLEWANLLSPQRRTVLRGGGLVAALAASGLAGTALAPGWRSPTAHREAETAKAHRG